MHMTTREGEELVMQLRDNLKGMDPSVEVAVAPPFTTLYHLNPILAGSPIKLCAQDVFWERQGAYTGEISTKMLVDTGCEYVIIGHSERRQYFCETNETVNKKAIAAMKDGLKPILCVGESLQEREDGRTLNIIKNQVEKGLKDVPSGEMKDVTIAYEPVWAIGTGRNAAPAQAEDVHSFIRNMLYEMFGLEAVKDTRIIYGGSVKPDNIDSLMAEANIDGALVGGASLSPQSFARIVKFQSRV